MIFPPIKNTLLQLSFETASEYGKLSPKASMIFPSTKNQDYLQI